MYVYATQVNLSIESMHILKHAYGQKKCLIRSSHNIKAAYVQLCKDWSMARPDKYLCIHTCVHIGQSDNHQVTKATQPQGLAEQWSSMIAEVLRTNSVSPNLDETP